MNPRRWSNLALSAMTCALVASPAFAQTTGGVRGSVKAKGGGAISGATLSLRNKETGFSRIVRSDPAGGYQFSLMPVGEYELTITATGHRPMKDSNLRVNLGQNTVQNFNMDAAEAAAVVEVVAQAAALDATQMTTITSVDDRLVESIPLNGRNFTDLVALTPMAAPGDDGRVSVGGARGIQNNLTIDGASYQSNFFGEQRGSNRIPFAFGADTIKELQIITNAYDAQYGNAAGAVINAVSKTGTNEFSGSLLLQIRPESTVAKIKAVPAPSSPLTNTEKARTKKFNQQQFNFNFGGPIIKDKLHFFVGVETFRYKEDFTPAFAISTSASSGNNQAGFDAFLPVFGKLKVGNDGRTLGQESGFTYTNDKNNTVYFGRLDWTLNENHRLTLRVNAQDWESENGTTSLQSSFAATTGQTNQGLELNSGTSWVLELNSIIGTNWVNEARFQRAIEKRPRNENTTASPEFQIDSGFTAGQNNFLPNGLDETTLQFIDNLTYSKGDWLVKVGVDLQSFDFKNTFFRYQNGQFRFSNYATATAWSNGALTNSSSNRLQIQQSFSNFGGAIEYSSKLFAGYVQAAYSGLMDRRLTLNLGLRYTKEDQPDNPRPNPELAGLDKANDPSAMDPRFGFTFDPKGNGKTIIRGGYGHFSSPNASLTVSNTMNSNGNTTSTYFVTSSGASSAILANFNTGPLAYAQRFSSGGTVFSTLRDESFFRNLGAPTLTGQVWDPENEMTIAKRVSIGVERQLDSGWKLGLFGVYTRFENLQYFVNINLFQLNADGTSNPDGIYRDGYPTKVNRFTTSTRPGVAYVRGTRLDLAKFGNVALSQNGGEGRYQALVFTAQKFSDRGYGVQSSFTLSKARDNNSNERVTFGADSGIPTPADPMAVYGFSDNDRRFRVTVAGYFPVIWGIKGSANYSYTTGRPFTARYTGDVNGDGLTNDIAVGYERNSNRQPGVRTLDARFSRDFKVASRFRIETFIDIYNVMNWANFRTDLTAKGTSPTGTQFSDFGNLNIPDRGTRDVQFGARFRF